MLGTISAFAYRHRETKRKLKKPRKTWETPSPQKTCCRGGHQEKPETEKPVDMHSALSCHVTSERSMLLIRVGSPCDFAPNLYARCTFSVPCTVMYMCKEHQQNTHFFLQWFNSTILFSTCFEHASVYHHEDCTSRFMVLYHAEVIIKLYELCRYKMLSSYNVNKSIKCFELW